MTTLLSLDESLFYFINTQLQNGVMDAIMPWWRDKETWFPLYIIILLFSVYRFKWKGLFFVLAIGLSTGLSDLASSKVMKPSFERLRPCNDPAMEEKVRLLVGCGKAYSFTSSHAANHFAIATFIVFTLGLIYPGLKWPFYFWAFSISLGQVYVGVHYPTDVIVGGLIGWTIGYLVAKAYLRVLAISIISKQPPEPSVPAA
ncbi:MAG: phosphatase PAP2 family protein [Saprospiraceae bacterium]|nr:phosphatase PAP2 family protein [Saprospiraceae bacterium]